MKKEVLISGLLLCFATSFAQKIHSNGEILQLLSDSKIAYDVKILEKHLECKDLSDKLNYHNVYRITTDSGLFTYKFQVNDLAKPFFNKGEDFFKTNTPDSALIYYQKALSADSSLYLVMTYIGQIYGSKGDYPAAIKWYRKAIEKNYIDYMAHWFLADTYLWSGKLTEALDEIAVARVLNRNNPRIKESFLNILKKAKKNTEDWCFNPQVELTKVSDNKITVSFDQNWTGYALAKALWTYEPGYRESMGVQQGQYSTLEDKECLLSLMVGLENAKVNIKKDPQLRILKEAFDKKHVDEYILFEIVLPQSPFVAFQLPKEQIQGIKEYILNIRHD